MKILSGNTFDLTFSKNSTLNKLIYINVLVYLVAQVVSLLFWLMASKSSPDQLISNWFAVPSNLGELIMQPWTLVTYMFLHLNFMHIFGNMLWLYFLGQLFVSFLSERKLLAVYILGGLAGALLYIISFNLFPAFSNLAGISRALGASASVMAIVVAVGAYAPNFVVRLLFFGDVKLKYIALVSFVLDVISISKSNSGGHIAHIGGAALGYLYATQLKKGNDITLWLNKPLDYLSALLKPTGKSKMKVAYKRAVSDEEFKSRKKEEQIRIDQILDKISKSGYDSLSKEEKSILFKASNKN